MTVRAPSATSASTGSSARTGWRARRLAVAYDKGASPSGARAARREPGPPSTSSQTRESATATLVLHLDEAARARRGLSFGAAAHRPGALKATRAARPEAEAGHPRRGRSHRRPRRPAHPGLGEACGQARPSSPSCLPWTARAGDPRPQLDSGSVQLRGTAVLSRRRQSGQGRALHLQAFARRRHARPDRARRRRLQGRVPRQCRRCPAVHEGSLTFSPPARAEPAARDGESPGLRSRPRAQHPDRATTTRRSPTRGQGLLRKDTSASWR